MRSTAKLKDKKIGMKNFSDDCRRMIRHIDAMIDDYKVVANGVGIKYAVDFTEIYSYAYPLHKSTTLPIFSDIDDQSLGELVNASSCEYLFHRGDPVVMLAPHALEMGSFFRSRAEKTIRDFGILADSIHQKKEGIIKSADSLDIASILAKRTKMKGLSDQDKDKIKSFVNKSGADVYKLITLRSGDEGRSRVSSLFKKGRVTLIDEEYDSHVPVNEEVAERWEQLLKEKRPGSQRGGNNEVDALAMGQLAAINRRPQSDSVIVKLVTRSPTLHSCYNPEHESGEHEDVWPPGHGQFVRHPRSFFGIDPVNRNEDINEVIRELTDRKLPLTHFVTVFEAIDEDWKNGKRVFPADLTDAEMQIDRIKKKWKEYNTTHVLSEVSDFSHEEGWEIFSSENLNTLYKAISDVDGWLPSYLKEITISMLDSVEEDQLEAIEKVAVKNQSNRQKQALLVTDDKGDGLHFLKIDGYNFLFGLAFSSPGINTFSGKSGLEAIRTIYKSQSVDESERNLCVSYYYALAGAWSVARLFAKFAKGNNNTVCDFEACYFASVCGRFMSFSGSTEGLMKYEDILEESYDYMQTISAPSNTNIPEWLKAKYRVEKAYQAFRIADWVHYRDNGGHWRTPGDVYVMIKESLIALEEVANCEDFDTESRFLALNALCYHYAWREISDDNADKLEALYAKFDSLLKNFVQDEKELPIRVRHTIYWTRWTIANDFEKRRIAGRIRKIFQEMKDNELNSLDPMHKEFLDKQMARVAGFLSSDAEFRRPYRGHSM